MSEGQEEVVGTQDPQAPEAKEAEGQAVENQESTNESPEASATYKLGEKEYTAEELNERIMRAESYDNLRPEFDRKSQELAELRRLKEEQESKPEDTKQYSPEEQQAIDMVKRIVSEEARPLQEKLQYMEEKAIVDKEIGDLKAKYNVSEDELKQVMQKAVDMGMQAKLGNLENAYWAWAGPNKTKEAKQEGERKTLNNLQEKKAVLSINSKSNAKSEATSKIPKGFADAVEYLKNTL